MIRNPLGPPLLAGLLVLQPALVSAQAAAETPAATRPAAPSNAPSAAAAAASTFIAATRLGLITCAEKYRAYLERGEFYALMTEGQRTPQGTPPSDVEVADCVHQTGLKGAALYKSALKSASTPRERAAFGEYMMAWDAALKDLRRSPRETVKAWRARQKQTDEKLDQLQVRLEAAVNLQG